MKEREMFNIYYLNFAKAYELKMFFSNIVQIGLESTKEDTKDKQSGIDLSTSLGTKVMGLFDANMKGSINNKDGYQERNKMIETFEVKATKSIILDEVYQKASEIFELDQVEEGELIKVKYVKLQLSDEEDFRTAKLISNGIFENIKIPETEGIDINNIMNSVLKDYSYKLIGEKENGDKILIKIPLSTEYEFESGYVVDDTFIGEVTILGIYKGKVKNHDIKSTLDSISSSENEQDELENEIIESSEETNSNKEKSKKNDNDDYYYIDLIAILQPIKVKE
ncbi:hypothetical protein ETI05_00165 [Macrococcoides canis]|uniref:hypothetical protein n=1 Tax=Macrococcoides canis TaxID=1855823 RepID=UPI00105ECCB3|nr:hypothetical protein [Macrococcus canis]TDM21195.1 hypothetical protein ETI05_00165 [Macrococcus canis]TDM23964.1 hypothetical protein ETI02_06115 [Macrococcus canis]